MLRLKYKHISRSMSEINEEIQKIDSQVENIEDVQISAAIGAFCDWLCGIANVPMSTVLALAKSGTNALDKGVPLEDVNEFFVNKLHKMEEDKKP